MKNDAFPSFMFLLLPVSSYAVASGTAAFMKNRSRGGKAEEKQFGGVRNPRRLIGNYEKHGSYFIEIHKYWGNLK